MLPPIKLFDCRPHVIVNVQNSSETTRPQVVVPLELWTWYDVILWSI